MIVRKVIQTLKPASKVHSWLSRLDLHAGSQGFWKIQVGRPGIRFSYFDNTEGKVCCIFYKLEPIKIADAKSIFEAFDQSFSETTPICYTNIVGMMAVT